MTTMLQIADTLTLPLSWVTLASVVYGARGSGKTTLGAVVAEEVVKAKQRFCAIDLKGDWYGLKSSRDGKSEGLPVVVFGGDHADLPLEEGAGVFVAETIAALPQSTILDFEHFSKKKQIAFMADFFEALYHRNRDTLLLLMDEAQRYAPQKPMDPQEARCLGAVQDLVKLGRKHGIGPMLFTQRGSGLNKEASELCDVLIAFRTPGPLDQERVKDWLDANRTVADRATVLPLLAKLPTGSAVFASGHPDLDLFGVHRVRPRETFDSSATPQVGKRRVEPKRLAQPDLEALKTRMAGAIERAKAEDPKELQRQLAATKKALDTTMRELERVKAKPAPAPKGDPAALRTLQTENRLLRRAKDEAMKFLVKIEAADFLSQAIAHDQGAQAEEIAQAIAVSVKRAVAGVQKDLDAKLARADQQIALLRRQATSLKQTLAQLGDETVTVEAIVEPRARHETPRSQPAPRPSAPPTDSDPTLKPGQRTVLTAIAMYDDGVNRTQLSLLTGYKSSARDTYVGQLAGKGFVVSQAGRVLATAEGIAALGSGFERLPTGSALLEWWRARLPPGEVKVLDVVVAAYPNGIDRATISDHTAYKSSARDTYLGKLAGRRLVVSDGRGTVRAADELFEE